MAWWQDTYKYARLLMTLIEKTERHDAEIKELRAENKKLSATVQQLIFEWQRDRENAEKDRQMAEKDRQMLILQLENRLLRHERGLPLPKSGASEENTLL